MLLDFTENFDLKNFKTYKDIYSISQLDKLDPKKLYRLTFKGNLSFNADIPSEYIIHKKIFYKEFGNLYSILMHKIPRSVIKKAFDKYGNGSISEYEYVNTITESSVIKPSDMDSILISERKITDASITVKGKIKFAVAEDKKYVSYKIISEENITLDTKFTEEFTGIEYLEKDLRTELSWANGQIVYIIVDEYLSNLRLSRHGSHNSNSTAFVDSCMFKNICREHDVVVYWVYK